MPPKIKTDRDDIVNAAFEVAKREGVSAITAQSVAAVLNTSVAPIFRVFQTIEELRTAAMAKINIFHTDFIREYPKDKSEFLTYGLAYIKFAKEYPYLFENIMQPCRTTVNERLEGLLSFAVDCAGRESRLGKEQAKDLFFNVWIYTHGLACLVYKGSLNMTESEEKELLRLAFSAFYKNISKGEREDEHKNDETI